MLLTMTPDDLRRLLALHEPEVLAFGVRGLWLFGSTARGEAGSDSDLDILVEFAEPCSYEQYSGLRFFLEDLLGQTVDLVPKEG